MRLLGCFLPGGVVAAGGGESNRERRLRGGNRAARRRSRRLPAGRPRGAAAGARVARPRAAAWGAELAGDRGKMGRVRRPARGWSAGRRKLRSPPARFRDPPGLGDGVARAPDVRATGLPKYRPMPAGLTELAADASAPMSLGGGAQPHRRNRATLFAGVTRGAAKPGGGRPVRSAARARRRNPRKGRRAASARPTSSETRRWGGISRRRRAARRWPRASPPARRRRCDRPPAARS